MTTAGVQFFRHRGSRRICLPGHLHILHPDETHDGAPGTEDGFGYRILYLAPGLVRHALDGGPLPFVADPVQEPTPTTRLVASLLEDIDEPLSDLARVEMAATVADTLVSLCGRHDNHSVKIDIRAVKLVRECLAAHGDEQASASTLGQIAGNAGIDRFTITGHFWRALGTSPDRYRAMRRLELARATVERGVHSPGWLPRRASPTKAT